MQFCLSRAPPSGRRAHWRAGCGKAPRSPHPTLTDQNRSPATSGFDSQGTLPALPEETRYPLRLSGGLLSSFGTGRALPLTEGVTPEASGAVGAADPGSCPWWAESSERGRSGGGTGASLVRRRRERRLLQGAAPWLCLRFLLRSEAAIAAMGGSRDDEYDYLFKGGLPRPGSTPAGPSGAGRRGFLAGPSLLSGLPACLPAWVAVGKGEGGQNEGLGEPPPLAPPFFLLGGSPRGGGGPKLPLVTLAQA